ncbi:hypothetical protein ACFL34_04990 [Candidatus Sumerlaeota bacterium]
MIPEDVLNLLAIALLISIQLTVAFPASHAFLRGIAAARDPRHDAAHTNRWEVFGQVAMRQRLLWLCAWADQFLLLVGLLIYFRLTDHSSRQKLANQLNLLGGAVTMSILIAASSLHWAPRFKRVWALGLASIASGLIATLTLNAFIVYVLFTMLPIEWTGHVFIGKLGSRHVYQCTLPYAIPLSAIIAFVVWRLARRRPLVVGQAQDV